MRELATVIVGCGLIGRQYSRSLRSIGARVVAVCDPDPARRESVAALTGARAFATLAEAIAATRPDVVCICTPAPAHHRAVLEAAAVPAHVFLEKPMAETPDQARRMVYAMAASGRAFGFGLKMRFESVFAEAHRLVEAGTIGVPLEVVLTYNQNVPPPDRLWYLDEGVLLGSMPHPFDLANWWLGRTPERLRAETWCRLGHAGEDRVHAVAAYEGGARAVVQMAYHRDFPEVAARDDIVFQIVGARGYLLGQRPDSLVSVTSAGRRAHPTPPVEPFAAELGAFLEAASGGLPPPVSGETGLLIQEMTAAAATSAATGEWVELA